jgi:hypothetical protein
MKKSRRVVVIDGKTSEIDKIDPGYHAPVILPNDRQIMISDALARKLAEQKRATYDLQKLMQRMSERERREIEWQMAQGISQGMFHNGYE